MSYIVKSYPHGTFSWADFFSTDIEKSTAFLTTLFGWTAQAMPTGEGKPDYTMFSLDGKYVAGGSQAFDPSLPSFWSSYVTVTAVEEIVSKVEQFGGKVLMPAMDVLDSRRMATIQDPLGAAVSIWEPKKHIGAGIINVAGAMCWNELYVPDLQKAKDFYGGIFGWTFETDEVGYTNIKNNGRLNGGIFTLTKEMAQMPPNWVVYFTVTNIAESVNKIKELDGVVHMVKDVSVGKIAMVADPTEASFMLIEMSMTPEEWIE